VLSDGWGSPRFSTGLGELDARIGGIGTGEVWFIIGAPGQGRSMLLTQFAARLALHHRVPTWLAADRDPSHVVSGRLHASTGRVPLAHIADDLLTDTDQERLEAATRHLDDAPLTVLAQPHARHRLLDEIAGSAPRPAALLFDDPDWASVWDLTEARTLADRGISVIAAIARHRLLTGAAYRADLDPVAEFADLVIEVRHTNLIAADVDPADDQPGYAALAVLRNRRGPVGTALVAFEGHYARFVNVIRP
jgi:replicative DNA helicase